jgi:hypothetical protein
MAAIVGPFIFGPGSQIRVRNNERAASAVGPLQEVLAHAFQLVVEPIGLVTGMDC